MKKLRKKLEMEDGMTETAIPSRLFVNGLRYAHLGTLGRAAERRPNRKTNSVEKMLENAAESAASSAHFTRRFR